MIQNDKFYVNEGIKVVFADLDDTLITTASGATFPKSEWDWRPKFEVWEALRILNPDYLCIVSNQGGIELGFVNEGRYNDKLTSIVQNLRLYLPNTKVVYRYCKYNDKSNDLRKPNIGMCADILFANETIFFEYDKLLMIGDASGSASPYSHTERSEDYEFLANVKKKYGNVFACHYADVNEFCYRMLGFDETAKFASMSMQSIQLQLDKIHDDKSI